MLSPDGAITVRVPVAGHPSKVAFRDGDAILLCMKTNDTLAALDALVASAPPEIPIVCVQNGVENERLAARRFANVYAVPVRLPSTHLEPGVVVADGTPRSGVLDVGRYPPAGKESPLRRALRRPRRLELQLLPEPHAMRHKYNKLLMNLGNAIDAICSRPRPPGVHERAKDEARACYAAAGIEYVSDEVQVARRSARSGSGESPATRAPPAPPTRALPVANANSK